MRTGNKRQRKKCCECRCWFEPSHTAERSQKTCSKRYREGRRRKQARRRRIDHLDGYRADERQRQADCREHRRDQAHEGVKGRHVSRATLSHQEAILRDEVIESWDKLLEVSRARFGRRVGHLLGRSGEKLGHTGARIGERHAPP